MIELWKKRSITQKAFVITTLLLIISSLILYLILYFLLPVYYHKYKINKINDEVNVLLQNAEKVPLKQATELLDEFVHANNVGMVIWDRFGNVVYLPSDYLRMKVVRNFIDMNAPASWLKENPGSVIRGKNGRPEVYVLQKPILFSDGLYFFNIKSTFQPIDEASNVILMFMPYIGIVVLIMSVAGAMIYSRMITKPLLQLNKVARHMASLDFSQKIEMNSEDEIGELSQSLNNLSSNLQRTMADLQKANEQLKDDIQKEREMEEKRREFIATISHELKSPITAVKGQIEGMIYQIGAFKNRDKYLKRSYEIMNHMEKLVREVLDLSKLESHNLQLKKEKICLTDLIHSILHKLEYFSRTKQLSIQAEIPEDIYIQADPNLMEKAIANVLDNAMKYAKEQGTVVVKAIEENNQWVLKVLNCGGKIEDENVAKLFEPFYRVEKSRNRNTGGSGLGLYIVKQVLDLHEVQYELKNTSEGVLFTMLFPKV